MILKCITLAYLALLFGDPHSFLASLSKYLSSAFSAPGLYHVMERLCLLPLKTSAARAREEGTPGPSMQMEGKSILMIHGSKAGG